MKFKIPNTLNLYGFDWKFEKTDDKIQLKTGENCVAKCSLPERKIILKNCDISNLTTFHELAHARNLILYKDISELETQIEGCFWLSIFEQLNKKEDKKYGKRKK